MLTKREFDLLSLLAVGEPIRSQRQLAEMLGCSLGSVNNTLRELTARGYFRGENITPAGVGALEPYRVRRAIFLAAGFGARLAPITLNTPKPLVRVNGTRIIDTMLDAVAAAEIPEIVIVRGYLGEQFDQLLCKYPGIQFVENPIFNESNNISSAMCVRHMLRSAYVLEADLILKNPKLIRKYEYQSNLLGIPVDVTDDWCVSTDKGGLITSETVGGRNCYQMVGISYWTPEDGAKLCEDLQAVYASPGGKERYWEQTALVYKKDRYRVALRPCSSADITEVDTFSELKKLDKIYNI